MTSGGRTGLEQYMLTSASETGTEFGRGSYAAVVEVKYKGLRCAGKKIHDVFYEGQVERLLSNFKEECRLLSQLRHPHIVQFLGVYMDQVTKTPVLVMEYLPATLTQCIDKYGVMPEEISYSILQDISLGLHFLHCRHDPIIHRDLSANNVLLSTDMRAKISDLGVAKILQVSPAQLSTMTKAPGTQSYMPPEALRPSPKYNVKVDIFSYGVLIVHVFSGKWPFPSEAVEVDPDNPEVLFAVSEFNRRKENIKHIQDDHPLLPLVRQCLSNSPAHRPNSGEVHEKVSAVADTCPPFFTNRVELLNKITSSETKIGEAIDQIRKLSVERKSLLSEKEELLQELEMYKSTSMSSSLSHSTELEMTQVALSECQTEVELLQKRLKLKERELLESEEHRMEQVKVFEQRLKQEKSEIEEEYRSNIESIRRRHSSETAALEDEIYKLKTETMKKRESQSAVLEENYKVTLSRMDKKHQLQLDSKTQEVAAKDAMLASRSKTIESLREQLKQALASPSQPVGSKQVNLFSPGASLTFQECTSLPAPMFYITSTVIGNYLYAGGGFGGSRTADEKVERSVYRYSITDDQWCSPLPPAPVVKFALAQLAGKILLVGGRPKPSRVVANVYEYNEESKEWIKPLYIPPMPTPRSSLTAISWKSPAAILACGGFDKNFDPQTCVEIFLQKTNQWFTSYPLPFPRAISTYTIIGNTVYVVGGYKNNSAHGYTRSVAYISVPTLLKHEQRFAGRSLSSAPDLEPSADTPTEWKTLFDVPNFFTCVSSVGGCLLVIGGQSQSLGATSCVSNVYVYNQKVSRSSSSWQEAGELPHACTMCAANTLPTGELLVMGGCTNNGLVNRVYRGTVTLD